MSIKRRSLPIFVAVGAVLLPAAPASAQLIPSCVLTLTLGGILKMAASGRELTTQTVGGASATMSVVGTLVRPTVIFASPSITGPGASTSGATAQLAYSSPGGASRGFSDAGYSYRTSGLLDSLTIDAKLLSNSGFVTGSYGVNTTVTCQQ